VQVMGEVLAGSGRLNRRLISTTVSGGRPSRQWLGVWVHDRRADSQLSGPDPMDRHGNRHRHRRPAVRTIRRLDGSANAAQATDSVTVTEEPILVEFSS